MSALGYAVMAFLPRHWSRWIVTNAVLLFGVFWSLEPNGDPHSTSPEEFSRSGNHATTLTYALVFVLVFVFFVGFVHCWRRSAAQANPIEGSLVDRIVHR